MKIPTPIVKPIHSLRDLQLDPHNANRGTTRGRQLIHHSLEALGAGRAIVADRAGCVIAGNKTLTEATQLDLPVTVVQTQGDALVVVQRTDLDLATDDRARRLALADNRTSELDLVWDVEQLKALAAEGLDLEEFWPEAERERLFGEGLHASGGDPDRAVEPGPTDIRVGDLFAVGRHRVICGDATNPDTVARLLQGAIPVLMTTDPPYGVDYRPDWRVGLNGASRTATGRVANDDRVDWGPACALFPGDVAYVWHAGLFAGEVAQSLQGVGFDLRAQIIWSKQHFALSRGDYHWQHEPCWYAVRHGATARWTGDRTQSTVWEVPNLNPIGGGPRDGENVVTGHGTQKPVRLFEIPILNHTTTADAVYDPFLGSGSALIAAEKTGRRCYAIELDPRYVQAALTRWEHYTGARAERLDGGAGE
jgi:DNA modification methylase